jgi:hypothetical protein
LNFPLIGKFLGAGSACFQGLDLKYPESVAIDNFTAGKITTAGVVQQK